MSVMCSARIAGTFNSHIGLCQHHIDELERHGISAHTLQEPTPIRVGYVLFHEATFEFDQWGRRGGPEGVRAFLFLVSDSWGVALDIVAWSPALGMLASWLGHACVLGQEKVYAARLSEGLSVWRSPVGWLKANREGVVLIKPEAAADYLTDAGDLITEDAAHGIELDRLLTRPAPRILVPSLSLRKDSRS